MNRRGTLKLCLPGRTRLNSVLPVLALFSGCSLALAQQNLLPNASFEQLDAERAIPTGWTNWSEPNQAVFTLAAARTGVASVAVTDYSPEKSHGLRSPRIDIEPGKAYTASVWLKIERLERGSFALYLEYWRGPNRIANHSVVLAEAPDWRQLTLTHPAPSGATGATLLIYGSSVTVGRAYFDDASLVEADADD